VAFGILVKRSAILSHSELSSDSAIYIAAGALRTRILLAPDFLDMQEIDIHLFR
jgi:hypothetical protein